MIIVLFEPDGNNKEQTKKNNLKKAVDFLFPFKNHSIAQYNFVLYKSYNWHNEHKLWTATALNTIIIYMTTPGK